MDSVGGWDDETVGDALDVLGDLPAWELAPQRWEQVGRILDRMVRAIGAGSADILRDAIADLELSGPVRALRIGTAVVTGIPEPILERRNTLVHTLTGEQPAPADELPEAGHDRRPAR